MYDLLIIGGGSAALAAMMYARTKDLNVAMLYDEFGGKVGWHPVSLDVDQYSADAARWAKHDRPDLPGDDMMRFLVHHVSDQPHRILRGRALSVEQGIRWFRVDTNAHGILEAAAIIVATGATPVKLQVPGANRFVTHGLGYSIKAYAGLVTGKPVAVIGTTQRALHGTAELSRSAERVYLIAPHANVVETPIGSVLKQQPNVEILTGYHVKELIGLNHLEEVIVAQEHATRRLSVAHAFVDLGLVPNSQFITGLNVRDPNGFIIVDQHNATAVPGLFAAGDVTTSSGEHVLVAVGDGSRAAMSAYQYLLTTWLAERSLAMGDRS